MYKFRNVVAACSFFKTNSSLLVGSSGGGSSSQTNATTAVTNNIERIIVPSSCSSCNNLNTTTIQQQSSSPTTTCYSSNARHRKLHSAQWGVGLAGLPQLFDGPATTITTSEYAISASALPLSARICTRTASCPSGLTQQLNVLSKLKLHSENISLIGVPIYDAKRQLVEKVVEGVAEIARGASAIVLWSALERLLADGLLEGVRPWNVIVDITVPGPATNKIFKLVKRLEVSDKPENSRIHHFFKEVLK